jgi:hypothetical protein
LVGQGLGGSLSAWGRERQEILAKNL